MSVVIVGASHAGGQVAASLRQMKYEGSVTLIGAESFIPYQRPPLTKEFLRGEHDLDRITLRPQAFYEKFDISLRIPDQVDDIDRKNQSVTLANGEQINYETLVLATGSTPIRPPIPGIELQGIHLLRQVTDVQAILADIETSERIGIVGGGYIGLEAAASIRSMGKSVAVVEMEDRLLKRVATESLASYYQSLHTAHGVELHCRSQVNQFKDSGAGYVSKMVLSDGKELDVDAVIVGVGVRPNQELAERANLKIDNGIWVNEHCATEDPNIYAVGDCTNHPNRLLDRRLRLESVPNAMEQARVAASNIVGNSAEYASYPWFWSDQYDAKLQMVGFADERDDVCPRGDRDGGTFIEFHLKQGTLIGADAINSPREFMAARQLCGKPVDKEALEDPLTDLRTLVNPR